MKEEEKTRQQISDYTREIDAIKYKSIKAKALKADVEIDRLTNEKFYNPYDVLQLDAAATEEEIKKQYKTFAMILHPDKCKDPRAKDAWHAVEQAHKTLCDPDKRKVYLRIMHEARERTNMMGYFADRSVQNSFLLIFSVLGLSPVPAEAIVVKSRDVPLGRLLVAAFRVSSVLIGSISTGLFHALEKFRPSDWSLNDIFSARLSLCFSENIEISFICRVALG